MAKKSSRSTNSVASRRAASGQPPVVARSLGLLTPLGPVTARALFGGWGLYLDGTIFALIFWNHLYLRIDGSCKAAFLEAGGEPFVYQGKTKAVEMPYCRPPRAALSSAEALLPWAERALAAAKRARRAKAAVKPRDATRRPPRSWP